MEHPVDAAGVPTMLLPPTPEEAAFNAAHRGESCAEEPCGARWGIWPGALVVDPATDRALVFFHKIYAEIGQWSFHTVGSGVAIWDDFEAGPVRAVARPEAEHPTLMFDADEPAFGSAALICGGHLYVWSCESDATLGKPCHVARVAPSEVLDRAAWRYWNGGAWSSSMGSAVSVFDGNDILSISELPLTGGLLALYSDPMTHDVMLRTADRPEGPWSGERFVFSAERALSDEGWVYDALAHAEYAREDGAVQLVSYSRTTGFLTFEVRLVEVRLALD